LAIQNARNSGVKKRWQAKNEERSAAKAWQKAGGTALLKIRPASSFFIFLPL
jgi:hypothetical protein